MNTDVYIEKINYILQDQNKFLKITRNPTNKIKTNANKLISTLNARQDSIKLNKIIGVYKPGYIYGTIKTHKNKNPLRSIISQCPTPTYQLAKDINNIISPNINRKYMLHPVNL